ncbi:ABC transporter substrate-binding protein [Aquincola sp. S2]|uniref:ABC transporter substrate-binding protein n=1 Tax=Pseudaquabacterium terrae TaxID=2732868 RepID=A0ABX2ED24_9BURK|nr:ABC transporter substrate-binding protein [Aquabacterium terrae]NRF66618.1 ABC transporter substrate-binding protein [Aquabacterium terrae]
MLRRTWISALALAAAAVAVPAARAEAVAADVFVKQVSNDVIDGVKADKAIQAGDVSRIRTLVDSKVMPHVNFQRMTGMSVGPQWRSATPEQQKRMLEEFKTLMVNTYAGALTQVKDQVVVVKPLRTASEGDQVVRTEVRGRGEPIQLDYRVEKAGDGWKIYDVNVGGFWLVEAYKGQFAKDLSGGGLDSLITRLAEKNKATNAPQKN